MGRHKAASNCEIRPWLTAKADCREGRFIQIGNSLLLSKKFQELSAGAQILYLCAGLESGGRKTFTFPARAMAKYGISERTGRRHLEELIDKGFISCTCSGRITRTDSQYEFSLSWKLL